MVVMSTCPVCSVAKRSRRLPGGTPVWSLRAGSNAGGFAVLADVAGNAGFETAASTATLARHSAGFAEVRQAPGASIEGNLGFGMAALWRRCTKVRRAATAVVAVAPPRV